MNRLSDFQPRFNTSSSAVLPAKVLSETQSKASKRLERERKRRQSNQHLKTLFEEWAAFSVGLEQSDLLDLAARVGGCCLWWAAGIDASGRRGIRPERHCHVKFCPSCAGRRSARMARRFAPPIRSAEREGHRVRFLTLTIKNVSLGELRGAVAGLFGAWSKLRRQQLFAGVVGTLAALDMTINPESGEAHPHLHIIILGGSYIPQAAIAEAWEKLTGAYMVDIRATDEERLKELLKYQIKPTDIKTWEQLQMLYGALHGVRALRATGCLRGLNEEPDDGFDEELDDGLGDFVEVFGFFSIDDQVLEDWLDGSISIEEMRARSRLRVT